MLEILFKVHMIHESLLNSCMKQDQDPYLVPSKYAGGKAVESKGLQRRNSVGCVITSVIKIILIWP